MSTSHRTLRVALAALAVAAGLSAVAAEIDYHATYSEARDVAEKQRKFIMVVVVAPGKDGQGRDVCMLLREETLPDEKIAKLIDQFFAPFLLDLAAVQARKQTVPTAVRGCFKQGEPISVPLLLFLDAKGKEVDRIAGYAPAQNYYAQVKKVADKALELVPAKRRRDVGRAIERGQDAFDREDFNAAMDALEAALTGGVPGEQLERAKDMRAEIETKATERLQEGEDLQAQGKLGSAVRAYRECIRKFRGTDAAEKATDHLIALRKDTEVRERLSAVLGRKLLATGKAAMEAGRYAEAAEAFDAIIARYPKTEQAAEAKTLRKKLDSDPDIAQRIREDRVSGDATRLLAIADGLRRNKRPRKALAEYRKVVERFPGTRFAATAKKRIAEIQRELGD